jgi:fructoselysine 6-kinase
MRICALSVGCIDIYPEKEVECVGGNSVNFLFRCAELIDKKQLYFVGALGRDSYGSKIIAFLEVNNISLQGVEIQNGNTASNKIYIDEYGERYSKPGDWNGGVFQKFRLNNRHWQILEGCDMISIPYTDPNFESVIENLNGKSMLVVDYLDNPEFDIINKYKDKVDIALISADENAEPEIHDIYSQTKNIAIVTKGAQGSTAFCNGIKYKQDAIEVDQVIDTTGCGDAYLAAFAITYFQTGLIKESMLTAAVKASEVLKKVGAVT